MKVLRAIASEVGRGLIAGFVGAVAMTISSTLEMKLRRRPPSSAPADAAGKVLGIQPRDEKGKQRFATVVHYAYGSGWGLARAALAAATCAGRRQRASRASQRATRASIVGPVAHFAIVWGASLAMLPALGIAKPFWRWGAKEVAIDAFHHTVYAAATDGAYRLLGEGLAMRRTTRRWVRALGLAAITGSRTALGPALAFGGRGRRLALCTRALAALEMLGDKHPRAPNRTAPLGLGFRIASAATVVRAVLKRRHGRAAGAGALALGAAVAVVGAFAGIRLRRALTRLLGGGPRANALAGAIEDLALIAAGRRLAAVR